MQMHSCFTPALEVLLAPRPHHSCLHQLLFQTPLTPELRASAAGLICEAKYLGSSPTLTQFSSTALVLGLQKQGLKGDWAELHQMLGNQPKS